MTMVLFPTIFGGLSSLTQIVFLPGRTRGTRRGIVSTGPGGAGRFFPAQGLVSCRRRGDTGSGDPTTFVIDPAGVLRKVYEKVKLDEHERVLLDDIAKLVG